MLNAIFVIMRPGPQIMLPGSVEWKVITQDGVKLSGALATMDGWGTASTITWARRDSGIDGHATSAGMRSRYQAHYPNGYALVEVSPFKPCPPHLSELFAAAQAAFALQLDAA